MLITFLRIKQWPQPMVCSLIQVCKKQMQIQRMVKPLVYTLKLNLVLEIVGKILVISKAHINREQSLVSCIIIIITVIYLLITKKMHLDVLTMNRDQELIQVILELRNLNRMMVHNHQISVILAFILITQMMQYFQIFLDV